MIKFEDIPITTFPFDDNTKGLGEIESKDGQFIARFCIERTNPDGSVERDAEVNQTFKTWEDAKRWIEERVRERQRLSGA